MNLKKMKKERKSRMKRKMNRYCMGSEPVRLPITPDMKPYNIAIDEENDTAEVNMYGEIVSSVPTDWWTGEKIDGLYIALADFLNDMEELKDKSQVTFHINSPGGEVFAGVSIYNKMKSFKGTVKTVVDGLAASAASIIAQGATPGHRKVCNGSLTMIHGASCMLYGYYNANKMKDQIKQLDAIDKSMAAIYSANTGVDIEKAKSMMSKTTWMTAEEAIENGFADEMVETNKVTMCLSDNREILTVNGIPMSAKGLYGIPQDIPVAKQAKKKMPNKVTTGSEPDVINKQNNGGKTKMTKEELLQSDPELVKQIRDEAKAELSAQNQVTVDNAVKAEIDRLKAIDEIASKIGNPELVAKAKYGETKMSAAELALEALKNQADAGKEFINSMNKDVNESGTAGITPEPNSNLSEAEQKAKDIADGAALIAGVTAK